MKKLIKFGKGFIFGVGIASLAVIIFEKFGLIVLKVVN